MAAGGMITSPADSRFSAIAFPINPWAKSDAALVFLLSPNGASRRVGPTSFALVWPCWRESISHRLAERGPYIESSHQPAWLGFLESAGQCLTSRLCLKPQIRIRFSAWILRAVLNGRHERLHRTLKEDTASPPTQSLVEQTPVSLSTQSCDICRVILLRFGTTNVTLCPRRARVARSAGKAERCSSQRCSGVSALASSQTPASVRIARHRGTTRKAPPGFVNPWRLHAITPLDR